MCAGPEDCQDLTSVMPVGTKLTELAAESCPEPCVETTPDPGTLLSQCDATDCQHGGTCYQSGDGLVAVCECPVGWEGPRCDRDTDECSELVTCLHGGTCSNLPGSYTCTCQHGWEGEHCQVATSNRAMPSISEPSTYVNVCASDGS